MFRIRYKLDVRYKPLAYFLSKERLKKGWKVGKRPGFEFQYSEIK